MRSVITAIIGLAATTGVTATVLSKTLDRGLQLDHDADPNALYDCLCQHQISNGSFVDDHPLTLQCCPDEDRHNDFHLCTPLDEGKAWSFVACCADKGHHHKGDCKAIKNPNTTATVTSASPTPTIHGYPNRDAIAARDVESTATVTSSSPNFTPTMPPRSKKECQCWGNWQGQVNCCVIAAGTLSPGCVIEDWEGDDQNFQKFNDCCDYDVKCTDVVSTSTAISTTSTSSAVTTATTSSASGTVVTASLTFDSSGFATVTVAPPTTTVTSAQPTNTDAVLSCTCGNFPLEPIAACCHRAGGSPMDDIHCNIQSGMLPVFEECCAEPHCTTSPFQDVAAIESRDLPLSPRDSEAVMKIACSCYGVGGKDELKCCPDHARGVSTGGLIRKPQWENLQSDVLPPSGNS
ncbi:hypothetical protein V8F20_005998 [Naviculisporaceae sp. PSN 640]